MFFSFLLCVFTKTDAIFGREYPRNEKALDPGKPEFEDFIVKIGALPCDAFAIYMLIVY